MRRSIFCLIIFNPSLIRAREKTPVDNYAAMQQNGGSKHPRVPQKRVRFAHGAFDWEGCSSPLPNPPRRFATNGDHVNGRQHDCRKPKGRSPRRSSDGRQQPNRKTPAGNRATAISFDSFPETASEMLPCYGEARKDRSVRVVARTRLFRSDKAA